MIQDENEVCVCVCVCVCLSGMSAHACVCVCAVCMREGVHVGGTHPFWTIDCVCVCVCVRVCSSTCVSNLQNSRSSLDDTDTDRVRGPAPSSPLQSESTFSHKVRTKT